MSRKPENKGHRNQAGISMAALGALALGSVACSDEPLPPPEYGNNRFDVSADKGPEAIGNLEARIQTIVSAQQANQKAIADAIAYNATEKWWQFEKDVPAPYQMPTDWACTPAQQAQIDGAYTDIGLNTVGTPYIDWTTSNGKAGELILCPQGTVVGDLYNTYPDNDVMAMNLNAPANTMVFPQAFFQQASTVRLSTVAELQKACSNPKNGVCQAPSVNAPNGESFIKELAKQEATEGGGFLQLNNYLHQVPSLKGLIFTADTAGKITTKGRQTLQGLSIEGVFVVIFDANGAPNLVPDGKATITYPQGDSLTATFALGVPDYSKPATVFNKKGHIAMSLITGPTTPTACWIEDGTSNGAEYRLSPATAQNPYTFSPSKT